MISTNQKVQSFVEICKKHEVADVIFSAGSRNAPLVISFGENHYFNCSSMVDERSAAFYALGIAQQKQQPVIISCTSGSAALNYAPAIAEAYYQNIPIIIVTADRPPEWIDHGEGQAIRQSAVFENYIEARFNVPIGMESDDLWHAQRIFNEAINTAKNSNKPVHINIPFREPLYETGEKAKLPLQFFNVTQSPKTISEADLLKTSKVWNSKSKILILCGLMQKDERLNYLLSEINQDNSVVVLSESTANLYNPQFIPCIDRTLTYFLEGNEEQFYPEVVITLGGAIISKKIKSFLRRVEGLTHWHIGTEKNIVDTFQSLSMKIDCEPRTYFKEIQKHIDFNKKSDYKTNWMQAHLLTQDKHKTYCDESDWSDLKVTHIIHDYLPDNSNLHLSNSSPVRYFQLFDQIKSVTYNSNRGVSGIDGCTSTAAGAALANNKLTVLLTGDLGFVYDINALWNKNLPGNLRIIVINNSGGGIFRIIPGPDTTNQLEEFFEVGNSASIQHLAKAHQVDYVKASSPTELENILPEFFSDSKKEAKILEIFTPNEINPKVLEKYFDFLAN